VLIILGPSGVMWTPAKVHVKTFPTLPRGTQELLGHMRPVLLLHVDTTMVDTIMVDTTMVDTTMVDTIMVAITMVASVMEDP